MLHMLLADIKARCWDNELSIIVVMFEAFCPNSKVAVIFTNQRDKKREAGM